MSNVVATGRRMNGRDGLIAENLGTRGEKNWAPPVLGRLDSPARGLETTLGLRCPQWSWWG